MSRSVPAHLVAAVAAAASLLGILTAAPALAVGPDPSFASAAVASGVAIVNYAVDINEDGNLDIVNVTYNSGFNVSLGNGDGTFQARVNHGHSGAGWGAAVGDVNGDGHLDVFVRSNQNVGNPSVSYLGDGAGGFTAGPALAGVNGETGPVLADLDNDGKVDLAIDRYGSNPPSLDLYRGDGTGTFSFVSNIVTSTYRPYAATTADFNLDGYVDLVLPEASNVFTTVLLSDGTGNFNFRPAQAYAVSNGYGDGIGDVNGDGAPDIAYAGGQVGEHVGVLLYDASTGAFVDTLVSSDPSNTGASVGDFNGDGLLDVGALQYDNLSGDWHQVFYLNIGAGAFAKSATTYLTDGGTTQLAADFNNDCKPDVLLANFSTLLTNTSFFPAPVVTASPANAATNDGGTVAFTAGAAGACTSVQWQSSSDGTTFADITGATVGTLTFTAAYADNGMRYRAVFAGVDASTTGAAATLTVHPAPVVTNPAAVAAVEGDPATFTASGTSNTAPTAQWQVSDNNGSTWTDLTGQTANTYTIAATTLTQDQNLYREVYTSVNGMTTTSGARLAVTARPAAVPPPPPSAAPAAPPAPAPAPAPVPASLPASVPPAAPPVTPAAGPVTPAAPPVVYGVPTIGLAGRTIQYGEGTTVTGLTKPGSLVNVYGYTRPSTTYARLGQVRSDARGRYSFSTRLAANSRLYVVVPRLGKSVVVAQGVRSVVSLVATRTSRTTYWFAGTASPVHAGQLVTIYVRTARGGKAIFARTRADQNGDYRVSRTVAAYGTQTNVVFAHVGSGIVMLGNNSPDRTIVTNRAR